MKNLKRKEKHILTDLCKSKAKLGLSIILKIVNILSTKLEISKTLFSQRKILETNNIMQTHMDCLQITQDTVIKDYDCSSQFISFFKTSPLIYLPNYLPLLKETGRTLLGILIVSKKHNFTI